MCRSDLTVIPAKAGIQLIRQSSRSETESQYLSASRNQFVMLDSRFRGNDAGFGRMFRDRSVQKQPCVYILASQRNGTLYVGVTSDLVKRIWEHRNDIGEGFTKKHCVHLLVYFEQGADMTAAITREKQIKKWERAWKIELIESVNPEWRNLWEDIL